MVSVSSESLAQTEARLRAVIRRTAIDWLAGRWQYVESEPSEAIAMITIGDRRSWLCPADDSTTGERFVVYRTRFPAEVDNSGFVGWLAGRIKAATGSGVIVVCGYAAAEGGVYDYWGVPEVVGPAVRDLVAQLQAGPGSETLDGVVMGVVDAAASAQIGPETLFCFEQTGSQVTARYGGGRIADGWLVGTIDDGGLTFSYLQRGTDGTYASGRSECDVARDADGAWRVTERFTWDGGGSGTNILREIGASATTG